jgi:hypothetical protein
MAYTATKHGIVHIVYTATKQHRLIHVVCAATKEHRIVQIVYSARKNTGFSIWHIQPQNNVGLSILYIQPQNNKGSSIYAATKQHLRIVHIVHAATKNIRLSILYMQPKNKNFHVLLTYININIHFILGQQSHEHFNLPLLLSCNDNNSINFVTSKSTVLILPEDADALKHTAVLVIYIKYCLYV